MIHFIDMLGMNRMAFPCNVGFGWRPGKDPVIAREFYIYADGHCHQVTEEQYNAAIDQMGFEDEEPDTAKMMAPLGAVAVDKYDEATIQGMIQMMAKALSFNTDKPAEMILRDIAANAQALAARPEQPNLL